MRQMEIEAAAFGEAASDIHRKVPGPASVRPCASVKSAEPRRLKSFSGEGSQDQAGAVCRFTNSLDIYINLANVNPVHPVIHARLFLEASAADHMHTAYQSLSDTESMLWSKFCELLNTRFGSMDPDAEYWRKLQHLTQGLMTVAEYVHIMHYCFNGIRLLPVEAGERICRFQLVSILLCTALP